MANKRAVVDEEKTDNRLHRQKCMGEIHEIPD